VATAINLFTGSTQSLPSQWPIMKKWSWENWEEENAEEIESWSAFWDVVEGHLGRNLSDKEYETLIRITIPKEE
jgi:hypothetical protein